MNASIRLILSSLFLIALSTGLSAKTLSNNVDITAEQFQFDADTHTVIAKDNVKITQHDVIITGEIAHYKQSEEVIHLEGNIHLKKGPFSLKCNTIKLHSKDNLVEVIGQVQFTQHETVGTADYGKYHLLKETINIEGTPFVKRQEDTIHGTHIFVDLLNEQFISKDQATIVLSESTLSKK